MFVRIVLATVLVTATAFAQSAPPPQEGHWSTSSGNGDCHIGTIDPGTGDGSIEVDGGDGKPAMSGTAHSDGSITLVTTPGLSPEVASATWEVNENEPGSSDDILTLRYYNSEGTELFSQNYGRENDPG